MSTNKYLPYPTYIHLGDLWRHAGLNKQISCRLTSATSTTVHITSYLIVNVSPKNIQLTCFVNDYGYSLRIPLRSHHQTKHLGYGTLWRNQQQPTLRPCVRQRPLPRPPWQPPPSIVTRSHRMRRTHSTYFFHSTLFWQSQPRGSWPHWSQTLQPPQPQTHCFPRTSQALSQKMRMTYGWQWPWILTTCIRGWQKTTYHHSRRPTTLMPLLITTATLLYLATSLQTTNRMKRATTDFQHHSITAFAESSRSTKRATKLYLMSPQTESQN